MTLREILESRVSVLDHARLSERQQRLLTVARLAQFPEYRVRNFGTGKIIDQRQAIRHVRRRTSLGRFLVEVEQEIIRSVLEKARRSPPSARAGRKRRASAGDS